MLASDQSARLSELLADGDILATPTSRLAEPPPPGGLALIDRSLNGGFAGGPDGIILVTDRELFGSVRVRRPRALRRVVPRDLLERLTPGDHVVHIDHGIVALRRSCPPRSGRRRRRGARLPGAPLRGRGPDLGARGADRPHHALRRRRGAAAVASSAAASGSAPGRGSRRRSATWPRSSWSCTRRAPQAHGRAFGDDTPVADRDGGRVPVRGDAATSCARCWRSRRTWSATRPWTASSWATWATARPRWPSGRRSRPSRRALQVAVLVPTTVLAAQHLGDLQAAVRGVPGHGPDASPVRERWRPVGHAQRARPRAPWTWSSAPIGC